MRNTRLRDLDYATLMRISRHLDPKEATQSIRLALLSDAATQQLARLLRALFHQNQVNATIYEAPFDGVQLQAIDSESGLYQSQPDLLVILNAVQALRARFERRDRDAGSFFEAEVQRIKGVWDAIQSRSKATLIQSNFVMPYERHFGNFDQKVPDSFSSGVASLNHQIKALAQERPGVLIVDVDSIASWVGRRQWFDDRFWDLAKSLCAPENLPAIASNIVDIALSVRGRIVKCVVLDLDNTLWGGVIGDQGVEGIVLNSHGDGECFWRFQAYLKELRRRGILLAVCSKNEMSNAVLAFDTHPDMLLKRSDIAVFLANWDDKAQNIQRIREVLNIGFDSMVFLDDNPFERNLVRGLLPDVIVPELPEDPADYVRAISELNLFETASLSAEDLQRTELYRAEAERRSEQAAYANAEDFLRSLDMSIVVARFDAFHIPRIAQLIQRSNQFNLTTHRHTEHECEEMMKDPGVVPLYAALRDRLGDHGLIGIVVLKPQGDDLVILDWLMSCRVLARGVEQYLMNWVIEEARARNLKKVIGEYIRTAKNQMVANFFSPFGFKQTSGDAAHSYWELYVNSYKASETFISPAAEAQLVG